ncbi:DUF2653 family protein [Sporosarcina sp. Te-1]|uniref:DUF2653 family protein n=1 Tax=Sporosarcina sp. Te-1 TaxID=2818390 RepID=UPI001A9EC8C8|nr:DUF2653 family protein [Sporosarcina sp. Te-1]QTD41901.1 DUF2653 family protein [Sporosarcina sp. Te-1]
MAELTMTEQDIVNAICMYAAKNYPVQPEDVEVELAYDEEVFSAEAVIQGETYSLTSFQMIQAIRLWIEEVVQEDPFAAGIRLLFDRNEGIIASIH